MVVTAHADEAKASMLSSLSLRLTEQWWVRELPTGRQPIELGHVERSCFRGILESASPVYDPGGPVLQTEWVADGADVAVIELEAAATAPSWPSSRRHPGSALADDLGRSRWSIASDWYLGWPVQAPPD
jgi:hypothetical protein